LGAEAQSRSETGAYIKVPSASKGRFLMVLEEIMELTVKGVLLLVAI